MKLEITYSNSQLTYIDPKILIEVILAKLKSKEYLIISVTPNIITFEPIERKRYDFTRFDWGQFALVQSDQKTMVKLKYKIDIFIPLVFVMVVLICSILAKSYFGWLFTLPFILQEIIRVKIQKQASSDMLKEIFIK